MLLTAGGARGLIAARRASAIAAAADLDLCAVVDRFAFAMPVRREEGNDAVEILRVAVPASSRQRRCG